MIDLDLRSNRLEKEQQKRKDDAKKKRLRESALRREQEKREKDLAARAAQQREEREQAEIAKALADEQERILTGGVRFLNTLQPFFIEGDDDKVTLPENCLEELSQQDALIHGALTFRLSSSSGRTTHCGVREFSAPSGKIGIPKKVADSLISGGIEPLSDLKPLSIKFVVLAKCSYAKLKPKYNRFFDVGPIKLCLEENLRFHTALSVGDELTVWYRGNAHELQVVDMQPELQGSLIDTDVEIDLDFSEETTTKQQPQQQPMKLSDASNTENGTIFRSQPLGSTPATAAADNGSTCTSKIDLPPKVGDESEDAISTDNTAKVSKLRRILQPEPNDSESDTIAIKFKFPTGHTKLRRFRNTMQFYQLFVFATLEIVASKESSHESINAFMSKLQLTRRFPTRTWKLSDISSDPVFESSAVPLASLSDLDLSGSSETLIVTFT